MRSTPDVPARPRRPGVAGTSATGTSGDLRERILASAEQLFREIGYHKTTVADIAAAIGMSPGNIYRLFPSKKAVNEAVAERIFAGIEARLAVISERPGATAAVRLRDLVTYLYEASRHQFTSERRVHDMVDAAVAESWDVIRRYADRVDDLLRRVIVDGVDRGEFRVPDATVAARCVSTAILRFCHPALIAQRADDVSPTVGEMIDFVLAGLDAGHAPAPAESEARGAKRRAAHEVHEVHEVHGSL